MAAQTEYQRGFIDGSNKMKISAAEAVLGIYNQTPTPQEKEE
jgi:hypothetical protein